MHPATTRHHHCTPVTPFVLNLVLNRAPTADATAHAPAPTSNYHTRAYAVPPALAARSHHRAAHSGRRRRQPRAHARYGVGTPHARLGPVYARYISHAALAHAHDHDARGARGTAAPATAGTLHAGDGGAGRRGAPGGCSGARALGGVGRRALVADAYGGGRRCVACTCWCCAWALLACDWWGARGRDGRCVGAW